MIKDKERKVLIEMAIREVGGCERCGSKKNLQLHHIQRKVNGGKDIGRNLMVLCQTCHKLFHENEIGLRRR